MPSLVSPLTKRNETRQQQNSTPSTLNIQPPPRNNSASRSGHSSPREESTCQPIDSMEIWECSSRSRGANRTHLSSQSSRSREYPIQLTGSQPARMGFDSLNTQSEQNADSANFSNQPSSILLRTSPSIVDGSDSINDNEASSSRDNSINDRDSNTFSLPRSSQIPHPEQPSSSSSNSANENPAFTMFVRENHWLPGIGGNKYSLVGRDRRLRRYNSISNDTTKTRLRNVDQIKLGANKTLYALSENEIIQLNKECSEPVRLNTKQKVRDFAFTSNGLLFVLNKEGELFYHESNEIFKKQVSSGYRSLARPEGVTNPLSIAISKKGEIWLLSKEGDVRKGQISKAEGNAYKVEWGEAVSSEESFIKLETLPNGKIAGRKIDGDLLYHDSSSESPSWKLVSPDSIVSFEKSFSSPHSSGKVTTFLRNLIKKDRTSVFNTNPLKSVTKKCKQKCKQFSHYAYETQRKKESESRPESMEIYRKEIEGYENKLTTVALLSLDVSIDDQTRELIGGRLRQIKEKTENYFNVFNVPPLKPPKTPQAIIDRSKAILSSMKLVYQSAQNLIALDTAILDTLDRAIKENLLFHPKLSTKAAELVVDHAKLYETLQKLNNPGNSAEDNSPQEARETWNESLAHLISRSGIDEADSLDHVARCFDRMQNIFRERNDILSSVVKQLLPKNAGSTETKSIAELSEFFCDLVHTMEPGESIGFEKSKNVGFKIDLISGIVALAGNWSMAGATPIGGAGKLTDSNLVILRTENGIAIKVSSLRGKYGQFGIRSSIGVPLFDDMDYVGWKADCKVTRTAKNEDSITFNIDDYGTGEVWRALTAIFSGSANLFDLLEQSASTELIKNKEKETKWGLSCEKGPSVELGEWSSCCGLRS